MTINYRVLKLDSQSKRDDLPSLSCSADRQTDRQTDCFIQTDRQLDMCRQTDRQTEHFGTWGEQGVKFLKKLSNQSSDEAGRPNAPEFLDFWRKRFYIQLQKCNAQVILKKLSGLCGGPEKPMALSTQVFPH